MAEFLELRNISAGYGEKIILKDISFKVEKGEFIALIGPNGAGKTTLFRTLLGIIPALKGEIIFKGQNFSSLSLAYRAKHIASLPQMYIHNIHLRVEEFILLGRFPYLDRFRRVSSSDIQITHEVIELLELGELKKMYVNELSGGDLQRVLIAQALVQQPELLLLDEPTTHLDIGHQIEIMDILYNLNQKGLTIITVLHDLNLASEYCQRLILLNKGRMVKDGTPHEVLDYRVIEEVYNTTVVVKENPYSKKPFLILIPRRYIKL